MCSSRFMSVDRSGLTKKNLNKRRAENFLSAHSLRCAVSEVYRFCVHFNFTNLLERCRRPFKPVIYIVTIENHLHIANNKNLATFWFNSIFVSRIAMFIRCRTVLLVVCVFVTLIQNEADAKPFLEYFYDSLKFQHSSYHKPHHHHAVAPAAPEPVGGKERFKQICNVIHGISDCYAWQMTQLKRNKKK